MIGMSGAMVLMMVPTAAPFFFAYAKDTRRPDGLAVVVLVYVTVWALIGAAIGFAMQHWMMPASGFSVMAAIALGTLYTVSPWGRWARAGCRAMCGRQARRAGLRAAIGDGLRYSACCLVCSAGLMVAVVAVGMASAFVVAAAAASLLALKVTSWPAQKNRDELIGKLLSRPPA